MQFSLIVLVLILAGVAALFVLGTSDLLLGITFAIVIIGFIFAVSRIAKE